MLYGAATALELRQKDGRLRIRGAFPYDRATELARGRFEKVAPGAFQWDDEAAFLYAHDMARPLANVRSGSLTLRQTPEALEIEASLSGEISWAKDFIEAHRAGLVTGLSPGFIVPPGGEKVERQGDGILRTITSATLVEVSAVTKPAYGAAQIAARAWGIECRHRHPIHPLRRWRA